MESAGSHRGGDSDTECVESAAERPTAAVPHGVTAVTTGVVSVVFVR